MTTEAESDPVTLTAHINISSYMLHDKTAYILQGGPKISQLLLRIDNLAKTCGRKNISMH